MVIASVRDSGSGIDTEILPRLFTKLLQNLLLEQVWDYIFPKVLLRLMEGEYGHITTLMERELLLHLVCQLTQYNKNGYNKWNG
jgi:hypothetical protein